ncbi:MAG: SO_0444 family Cu/Zn efflux transporter [Verrucomicrobiota bacterium]|nr:SO_0444 family Cu/Zn efflux transporter [Verrucomicrobiota bacterium]MEC8330437.1 SO_0444 family Cu/Zn efflux transporter [Verrucomicrobiota bacterium]
MILLFIEVLHNSWTMLTEIAPYLIVGFFVAGLLQWLINPMFVRQQLGQQSLISVLKATILGIPMPLCSCSVIPVAASIRKSGASKGATASFLSSTPQTGVDSILATYALMGGFFTFVRVLIAFISGVISGLIVQLITKKSLQKNTLIINDTKLTPLNSIDKDSNFEALAPDKKNTCNDYLNTNLPQALEHGLIVLPADLFRALTFGILIAGIITTFLPESLLGTHISEGYKGFFFATIVSLPLYVCATASIPMAYALIGAGLSPGAALVFLIIGPATNTTTISAAWTLIGRQATFIYLLSIVCVAWFAGGLLDSSLSHSLTNSPLHEHQASPQQFLRHLWGILLVCLLINAYWKVNSSKRKRDCCQKT